MTPSHWPILWPTLAMVALTFGVWFALMRGRLHHIADHPPSRHDFASGEALAHLDHIGEETAVVAERKELAACIGCLREIVGILA